MNLLSTQTLRRPLAGLFAAGLSLAVPLAGQFGTALPTAIDEQATMEDRLGEAAVLDGSFVDELGREVQLSDLVGGERPVLLNLGYYRCPSLCGLVRESLLKALEPTDLKPGVDFDLVSVSVADTETPKLALEKKLSYIEFLGGADWTDSWHFLTGPRESIDPLAASVGWRFRKDELSGEYDHPPTLVLLSPSGVVTRYLDARFLDASTLRRNIIESSDGKVGSFVERILVSCLTFDPSTGAYTMTAMTVMRIGGLLTVFALSLMILLLWRRERRRRFAEPETAVA